MTTEMGTFVPKNFSIERRIVCRLCSGAKHTFQHSAEGLRLYTLHMDLVHRVHLSTAEKTEIANV